MIEKHAADLAAQMGINLTRVSFFDGKLSGSPDFHLLQMHSNGQTESAIIFQLELEDLQKGITSNILETRLRKALSRLQAQLDPYP